MRVENNMVFPDAGKILKTASGLCSQIALGEVKFPKEDGSITTVINTLDNIKEVFIIRISDEIYYVESTKYNEIVSELIRKRYSLDDELALIANSRLDPNSKEELDFQNWRKICKLAAKDLINE